MIRSIKDLEKLVAGKNRRCTIALAAGDDIYALEAISDAKSLGLIKPLIVGDLNKILELSSQNNLNVRSEDIVDVPEQSQAVEYAIKSVSSGSADILMKGSSSTSMLLKAVLNKEWGLRKEALLSHISIFEIPLYHKLLGITDVAINIAPDAREKIEIVKNAVDFLNKIGMERPKVALLAAVEKVYDAMQATTDAAEVKNYFSLHSSEFSCVVDGPMALDNAVSKESAEHKGIKSEVAGDADLLVVPQIESGNILYKALAFFANASSAAIVLGASAPIVLTSRADSREAKLNSILLAAYTKLQDE